ncbi:hypothetical protein, partial [Rhodococcus sp. C-2]|uniref:hypothetical protein n=1 Tax=Rhodococcus sp. C-2 TaxID=3018809 RepID=UPI0022EABB99
FQIIPGKVRPLTPPRREPSTGSDHCSPVIRATIKVSELRIIWAIGTAPSLPQLTCASILTATQIRH